MKIADIYRSNNRSYVSIAMALMCIVITLITAVAPQTYNSLAYAFPMIHPWQILSGIFVHGSPAMPASGTIGHLGFNLLLVLPFGILIEKMIGSKKFFAYTAALWIINAVTFYLIGFFTTPQGERTFGAGISGIAFSYGVVGLYALIKIFRKDVKGTLNQKLFYFLLNIALIMLIMTNPFIAGVSSMIMHAVAIIVGVFFLITNHKDIDRYIEG